MKKKQITLIISCLCVVLVFGAVFLTNILLTNFIDNTNTVCKGQKFSSAQEALQALEASECDPNDTSLDYCPPYTLLHTFEYEGNTIVMYSYCQSFNGEESSSYAIRILQHNNDGTLSFNGGFTDFCLNEPNGDETYYFTNFETPKGKRSISFLYLPSDSEKDIYVDGIKAEKILVSLPDKEFYVCCAISNKDTFLSNLFTSVSNRHKVEMK